MNPTTTCFWTTLRRRRRVVAVGSPAAWSGGLMALVLSLAAPAATAGENNSPFLEFVEPTTNAIFSTLEEIPIVLRAFVPNDVVTSAEVLADQEKIAQAVYCCLFCPCPPPPTGQETILRIPVDWDGGATPPPNPWRGWTNVVAGTHRLTARAVSENGTQIEAAPVSIMVLDLTLVIYLSPDGGVTIVIPQGSLVPGGYELEGSEDLRTWTRLGPFLPGNVAAFYFEVPANARQRRFYRSVRVP